MIQTNCTDITGNCIISSHPLRRHSSGRMEAVFSGGFEVVAAAEKRERFERRRF